MTKQINFSEFDIRLGYINFKFNEINLDDQNLNKIGNIFFELKPEILPRNDLIALAITTLCGKAYSKINFDINISQSILSAISTITNAEVTALLSNNEKHIREKGNNITLNFSGGFDSLSAKSIMPENTNLVSMDFGGRFSRERTFFENFSPCIVKTNLVDTHLRKNSWSFMGIASLLFSDFLKTNYHTFGSILEAATNNFSENPIAAKNFPFPIFYEAGIENAPYVLGLTEVGTLKLLSYYHPEFIAPSLESLATPGEEKRYRKQVLALIVEKNQNTHFKLNCINPPAQSHFTFGQSFAPDFLAFYVIKHAGLDIASHTISNIPDLVVKTASNLSLSFYEKYNPKFLENFPPTLKEGLVINLSNAGIDFYNNADWDEFNTISKILSQYYPIN